MFQSVIDIFPSFSRTYEGYVLSPYLDVKGLVTVGVGNLIDPVSAALALPWKLPDGSRATPDVIRAQWSALKARQDMAHHSVQVQAALTTIRLTPADVDALVLSKLSENADFISAHYFPAFGTYPADAQLGIMSMAWAVGAGFPLKFPHFKSAVLAGDWTTARDECAIQDAANPGVIPRNAANRVCFGNAQIVVSCGLAPDILRWPNVAQQDVPDWKNPTNIGTLAATALDDARIHALEVTKLEGDREMAEA